jgi:hypothetical protein
MNAKPKTATKKASGEDSDYVDIEDEEQDEDDIGVAAEDITPEKLDELLNDKTMQRIFQRFDENMFIRKGKNKFEINEAGIFAGLNYDDEEDEDDFIGVGDHSGSDYDSEESCMTPSSNSS